MFRRVDDLADELIANNVARPIPGMEKPDLSHLAVLGLMQRKHAMSAEEEQRWLRLTDAT